MKYIKHVFYQRPGSDPLGGLRGWDQKVKIQLFQNMVMLHIKLKGLGMQRRGGPENKVKIHFFQNMAVL